MQKNNVGNISKHKCLGILCILTAVIASIICGCGPNRHAVVAVTGTNIGVEISQNPANQTPQAKLGYQRSEIAIVPTNRSGGIHPGSKSVDGNPSTNPGGGNSETDTVLNGAKDVADVLMELKYSNIFSLNRSGIYQRLAVGETAVQQSALMFARDEHGDIGTETATSVIKSMELGVRKKGFVDEQRQKRVAQILGNIDMLDDSKAFNLESNPPVKDDKIDKIVALRDPTNQRATNGKVAREMLKMRAVLSERSDADLEAWEAAVKAIQ